MSKIIFTIDVEPDLHKGDYKGVTKGLKIAEKLFNKENIEPILFVTCDCIEKFPEIFQKFKKKAWEISLHGYKHIRFDTLSKEKREEHIKNAIRCFKKYLNIKPKGFRAPQHSINAETLDLLEKYGFKYDSSYTPLNLLQLLFFPRKFKLWLKNFSSPLNPYPVRKNLLEIPTSSFLLPLTSFTIRILPLFVLKVYIKIIKKIYKQPIFYCHSWDFIKIEKSRIEKYFSTKNFQEKLIKILKWDKIKN